MRNWIILVAALGIVSVTIVVMWRWVGWYGGAAALCYFSVHLLVQWLWSSAGSPQLANQGAMPPMEQT